MEVRPDLREGVLRRLALEVPQLMDGTALDQGLGPHEADGLSQARVPVDHAPQGRGEAAATQVGEAALPGIERLAPRAELQRQELLLPIGEDATTPRTGRLTTFPTLRTRRARASRYTHTMSSGANDRVRQASSSALSVPTIRETALLESGAALSSGLRAPRSRRVLPPAR